MSQTTNLKLFKHDNPSTNENQFDVESALNENWDKIDTGYGNLNTNKVDKEEGKGLSTNDFSDEYKEKLDSLENYNDAEIKKDIQDLESDVSNIKSNQTTQNDLLQRTQNALINITTPKSSNINVKDSSDLNAKVDVYGISRQKTRSGINLTNYEDWTEIGGNEQITEKDDDKVVYAITSSSYGVCDIERTLKPNTNYTACADFEFNGTFGNQYGLRVNVNGSITSLKTDGLVNFTTDETGKARMQCYVGFPYTGADATLTVSNIRLYEGTYTRENIPDYEQYGASPSPEYPSEIENVTGDINIKIYNKNLLDLTKCGFSNCVKNEDGSVRSNINNNYYATISTSQLNDFILQNKGRSLTFSFEGISTKTIGFFIPCKRANSDSDYFEANKTGNSVTMQIPEDLESLSYIQIRWNRQSTPFTDTTTVIDNIQLELNDTKTDFVKHEQQLITFPLKENQKLYDGDYLASDGIHHVRDVYIFKAVTSLSIYNDNKYGTNVGAVNSINTSNILSDRIVASDSAKENTGYITGGGYTVVIYGNPTDTVESFNEKFAGTKIEYPLAKEKIEPYTPEQQEAYNKLQNVLSYKTETNVFTDKALLVFKYIADTQTWVLNKINNTNQQILEIAGGK